jgi:2-oxoglutarate ferredoxin oxidoreductase subunit gamma
MLEELIFAGFGGQGILSIGTIYAYAAMQDGLQVSWVPSYGPEMRGGTANCTVIVSDELIGSPSTPRPTGVIAMNLPSLRKFEPKMKAGGVLIVNSSLIDEKATRTDITVIYVPTAEIATEAGSILVASVAALGALNEAKGLVKPESIEKGISWTLPKHRQKLVPMNMAALQAGMKCAQEQLPVPV